LVSEALDDIYCALYYKNSHLAPLDYLPHRAEELPIVDCTLCHESVSEAVSRSNIKWHARAAYSMCTLRIA